MPTNNFRHGKDGSLSWNASVIRIVSWNFDDANDLTEVTSTGIPAGGTLAGFKEFIPGLRGGSGSFTYVLDGCNVLTLKAGDQAALLLYWDGGAVHGWNIPKALLAKPSYKVDVNGRVEVSVDFTANGEFSQV